MSENSVRLELSLDEALVLFDWLVRVNKGDHGEMFEVQAEQQVLWNLEAILEKTLVEPLAPNYAEAVEEARIRLAGSGDV